MSSAKFFRPAKITFLTSKEMPGVLTRLPREAVTEVITVGPGPRFARGIPLKAARNFIGACCGACGPCGFDLGRCNFSGLWETAWLAAGIITGAVPSKTAGLKHV